MFKKTKFIKCYLLCKTHCDWILLLEKISESTARVRPTKVQDFKKLLNEFLTEHGACQLIIAEEAEFMPSGEAINDDLRAQLEKIEPSNIDGAQLRPCRVILKDGSALDRVYVVDSETYRKLSGSGPGECGKRNEFVSITQIARIEDSPQRVPSGLATKMYRAGESGMGYYVFTLVLRDGRRLPYVTSGLADFVNFPLGVSSSMVKDLLPHEGKEQLQDAQHHWKNNEECTRGSRFLWCLYRCPE